MKDSLDEARPPDAVTVSVTASGSQLVEALVATMRARRGPDSVTGFPEARAWWYVEFDCDDADAVKARASGAAGRTAAPENLAAHLRDFASS
ncbi:hypothetical protein ACIBW9_39215 [Streptomyces sp. NPDC049541]|uniref:hypothetical protein n=1 Tax=Streptomyces sp. NPDC049541 TaxID=3365594 RepID=UPI0037A90110